MPKSGHSDFCETLTQKFRPVRVRLVLGHVRGDLDGPEKTLFSKIRITNALQWPPVSRDEFVGHTNRKSLLSGREIALASPKGPIVAENPYYLNPY